MGSDTGIKSTVFRGFLFLEESWAVDVDLFPVAFVIADGYSSWGVGLWVWGRGLLVFGQVRVRLGLWLIRWRIFGCWFGLLWGLAVLLVWGSR